MGFSTDEERCLGCGEETAAGTVLFAGRHDIDVPDAPRKYLCDECYATARAAKGGELSQADLQVIAKNGVMIGAGFFTGGF